MSAGETFTLTATADWPAENADAPITILDLSTEVSVAECEAGVSCTTDELTFTTGEPREYQAILGDLESQTVSVARAPWTVTLTSSAEELLAGERATLTATLNQDLSDTDDAYVAAIFDITNGERVQTCTDGTECLLEVSAYDSTVAMTQYMAAVFAEGDTSDTPVALTDMQATSDPVEITRAPWTVTVTPDVELLHPGETTTVRITTNQDVGQTNGLYSIYVIEPRENRFLARCDTGTSCDVTAHWRHADPFGAYYLAIIAERQLADPTSPSDLNGILTTVVAEPIVKAPAWEFDFSSTESVLRAGESATVTTQLNMDLSTTEGEYAVYIADLNQNRILKSCDATSSCSVDYSFWFDGDSGYTSATLYAIISEPGLTSLDQMPYWHAASDPIFIDRARWTGRLDHSGGQLYTLETNQDVAGMNGDWAWHLIDAGGTLNQALTDTCTSGSRCLLSGAPGGTFVAFLARRHHRGFQHGVASGRLGRRGSLR